MTDISPHTPTSPALLSELIGLIYEAASDLSLWPQLLESMAEYLTACGSQAAQSPDPTPLIAGWFEGSGVPALTPANEQEQFLLACLAPHFVRAHDIHRQLTDAYEERNLLEGVMDRLPLGMALVDAEANALSINRALLSLVQDSRLLRLESGRLVSQPKEALSEALSLARNGSQTEVPLRVDDGRGEPLSLWVSRLSVPTGDGRKANRFVLLAASKGSRALSIDGLRTLFQLTAAEARLTQQLALGLTPDEAATTLGISANTVKTHLKRIFSKVGVRRQAELLQAIYASPLWLNDDAAAALHKPLANAVLPTTASRGPGLTLPDGRWLAYSDNGDPHGTPVILMHGLSGSRHLSPPDESILLRSGVRLIIPERPGSGDSDPLTERRIAHWPQDVAALADHLALERFAVLGYSLGTPYALATAIALGQRVSAVTLVGAVAPIATLDDLSHYFATFRMGLLVARYSPTLLPPLMRVLVKGIRKNVYRYIEQSLETATESDRQVLENPRLRANYAQGLLAGVKRGEKDVVLELLLAARDWGLDLQAVTHEVRIWHGSDDRLVTPAGATALAQHLPRAQLTLVPGGGHYIIYSHWEEILVALTDGLGRSANGSASLTPVDDPPPERSAGRV